MPATELVLRRLLPAAHEGLEKAASTRRTRPPRRHHRGPLREHAERSLVAVGAFHRFYEDHKLTARGAAAHDRALPRALHANEPVHECPCPDALAAAPGQRPQGRSAGGREGQQLPVRAAG